VYGTVAPNLQRSTFWLLHCTIEIDNLGRWENPARNWERNASTIRDPCHHVHNHAFVLVREWPGGTCGGPAESRGYSRVEDEARAVRLCGDGPDGEDGACNGAATAVLLAKTEGGRADRRPAGRVTGICSTQARWVRGSQRARARGSWKKRRQMAGAFALS